MRDDPAAAVTEVGASFFDTLLRKDWRAAALLCDPAALAEERQRHLEVLLLSKQPEPPEVPVAEFKQRWVDPWALLPELSS